MLAEKSPSEFITCDTRQFLLCQQGSTSCWKSASNAQNNFFFLSASAFASTSGTSTGGRCKESCWQSARASPQFITLQASLLRGWLGGTFGKSNRPRKEMRGLDIALASCFARPSSASAQTRVREKLDG